MLEELVELRKHTWIPRQESNAPKTIKEVHKEAAEKEKEKEKDLRNMRNAPPPRPDPRAAPARGGPAVPPSQGLPNMPSIYGPAPTARGGQPQQPPIPQQQQQRGAAGTGSDWTNVANVRSARGGPEQPSGRKAEISLAPAGGLTASKGWARGGPQQEERGAYNVRGGGTYAVLGADMPGSQPSRDSAGRGAPQREPATRNAAPAPAPAPPPPSVSIEKVEEQATIILDEFLSAGDVVDAGECIRDMRAPDFHPDFILFFVNSILEKKDKDREKLPAFFQGLAANGVFTTDQLSKGFSKILEILSDLLIDFPFVPKLVATSIGILIAENKLPLSYPITALTPLISEGQAPGVAATMGGEILRSAIANGKEFSDQQKREFLVNFARPGVQVDALLAAITKDKGLTSLFPTLVVQKDLDVMIQESKSIDYILKWVENAAPDFQADKGFAHWLMGTVLSKAIVPADISQELTEEQARGLSERLTHYALLLQRFLETTPLQLAGVFEVQSFWHSLKQPKHLLASIFQRLYDDDVVLEESFRVWREDTDDPTPGKLDALVQANRWLQWLETAEEESNDEASPDAPSS